ncbi:MAG: amidohydrolase family protein [Anaerolineae bacterium]|nr:amidohydrolase family protein [Anaerolineae bacterium]MDH7474684.1 amidohydrolase family protein [Anaerolineae bacterium]
MSILHLPGLIDIHVHLRDPGGTHKEDFATGTAAALAGGIVAVLDMPNNTPPVTDADSLHAKLAAAEEKAHCDYGLYLGANESNADTVFRLHAEACGLKMYLDQTYGPLRLAQLSAVMAHFRRWPAHLPIAVHAEGLVLAGAIALAQAHNQRVHLCHVSRAADIALIRAAKERGAPITCEVTPHHLFLTAADAKRLGPLGYMKPTLGTAADRDALWANLDVVDCIATDHAPHTIAEKGGENPPPGVPGLETALPLMLTAVHEGRLSLERLVELMHDNPVRIFGLVPPDSEIEIDTTAQHTISRRGLHTKCGWTPFEGMLVWGQVRKVALRGKLACRDGDILIPPGFGQPLRRTA